MPFPRSCWPITRPWPRGRMWTSHATWPNPLRLNSHSARPSLPRGAGQPDPKPAAFTGRGCDGDLTAGAGDEGLADRQAQTRALGLFGGKERIENPLEHGCVDPLSGVIDADHNPAVLVMNPEAQPALRPHGVNRVEDQVDDHLLQLGPRHDHCVFT